MPHWTKLIEHVDDKIQEYVEHFESGKRLSGEHWENIEFFCELIAKIHEAKETIDCYEDKHMMGPDNPRKGRGISV